MDEADALRGAPPKADLREERRRSSSTIDVQRAAFLRSCRERIKPGDVNLPFNPRIRVEGLRREDVAALSGVSASWYTWLEQGRRMRVSDEILDRLFHAGGGHGRDMICPGVPITDQNLVIATSIVVLDNSPDTAASLTKTPNTLIAPPTSPDPNSGGGRAIGVVSLLLLGALKALKPQRPMKLNG
jgi:transcriptional regulator with XRE-family HTH domain